MNNHIPSHLLMFRLARGLLTARLPVFSRVDRALLVVCLSFFLIAPLYAQGQERAVQLFSPGLHSPAELAVLTRLKGVGFDAKPRLYIRLFKSEKLLEVWVRRDGRYKLFQSFDICNYSGGLGPKIEEGDGQAPEGFYHIPVEEIFWRSKRWSRALNLAFPNVYDAQNSRTGSYLLIHGGCSSKGCYALEDGPMSQLYALVKLAARGGQAVFPIHIYPFRMTKAQWEIYGDHRWAPFWRSLQPVYDYFRKNLSLPEVRVCDDGYEVLSYRLLGDDQREVSGACVPPLPLSSIKPASFERLDWLASLKQRYAKLAKRRPPLKPRGLPFKVLCNMKRPSCRRWVALKQRRLQREQAVAD